MALGRLDMPADAWGSARAGCNFGACACVRTIATSHACTAGCPYGACIRPSPLQCAWRLLAACEAALAVGVVRRAPQCQLSAMQGPCFGHCSLIRVAPCCQKYWTLLTCMCGALLSEVTCAWDSGVCTLTACTVLLRELHRLSVVCDMDASRHHLQCVAWYSTDIQGKPCISRLLLQQARVSVSFLRAVRCASQLAVLNVCKACVLVQSSFTSYSGVLPPTPFTHTPST